MARVVIPAYPHPKLNEETVDQRSFSARTIIRSTSKLVGNNSDELG